MVQNFYDVVFSSQPCDYAAVLDAIPQKITSEMNDDMCKPYSNEEIKTALFQMFPMKAPGPDGFPGRFYATCWHIVRVDFMRALEQFHREDMRGMATTNKALVTLLPKKADAMDIREYRPVSLISGPIKIFDKVLATRLAEDLPKLIGQHQSAFVKGRSLHDNFMLV